ncbi:MAG: hypothetical protein ACREEW_03065 [Caulobacteraceae bacterium]
MIVSCFGVHWAAGDIPFLLQAIRTQNLISPELESPFITNIRPRRQRCPHQIDLDIAAPAPEWLSDPLAQAFLPVPRHPGELAKGIVDPTRKLERTMVALQRLSTPTETLVRPIWFRTITEMRGVYAVSNLSPLIWIGIEWAHAQEALRHVLEAEAFQRHILLVGNQQMPIPGVEWIETELGDVSDEPLEAIGAGVVQRYMENGPV